MAEATAKWAPEGSPVSIEYPLEVMARIRDHAIVGFHRLAKRGVECGGILLGYREGRRITIAEIREIHCEYKSGPSFVLSDSDKALLREQLQQFSTGLVPVGCYISHTKDDICATERDIANYNEFFPDPWQVMLILRPGRQGAVRAGFFVRESLGQFRAESSYEEFQLDAPDSPAESAALIAAARQQNELSLARPRGASAAAGAAAGAGPVAYSRGIDRSSEFPYSPMPAFDSSEDSRYAPAHSQEQPAHAVDDQRLRLPQPPQRPVTRERHWSWLVAWLGAMVLIGAITYWLLSIRTPGPILLRVSELNGDMHIEWDRTSTAVRRASVGSLEIRDGQRTRDIQLSQEQLAMGHYLFPVGSGDVAIRLSVDGLLMPRVEESANYVAQVQAGSGPRGAAEIREQRDRLVVENRKLRNDVRRLEERLKSSEERLAVFTRRANKNKK